MIPCCKDNVLCFEIAQRMLHLDWIWIFVYLCEVKVLIVRFSSIGDIVLTSPVVRAMKDQFPNWEIHYITKEKFKSLVTTNPHISKVYTIDKSIDEVIKELKKEKYDHVLDLHHNIRTGSLITKLNVPSSTFRKLNVLKWMLVKLKINRLPQVHVVERYFEAADRLGVVNDERAGEFFIPKDQEVDVVATYGISPKKYVTVAIGAQFNTKRMPAELLINILSKVKTPIVLIGGPTDLELATEIMNTGMENVINTVGTLSIQQSASVIAQSRKLLTNDTGMMHIAACLDVDIVSVWGNTVRGFGMYPYYPGQPEKYSIHEVRGLSCRPCSKIGYQTCPKGHFKCMKEQDAEAIAIDVEQ